VSEPRVFGRGRKSEEEYRKAVAELSHVLCLTHYDQGETARAVKVFDEAVKVLFPPLDFDQTYLRALEATDTIPMPYRRRIRFHNLVRLLRETSGDEPCAEAGCYRGLSAYLIASEGVKLHVFDSFQGLSEPSVYDTPDTDLLADIAKAGHFAATQEHVANGLAGLDVELHPGWIPESFLNQPERIYRFVHVDVDLYEPTKACLEYFWPRIKPGGMLVSDDYNWPGAKKAIDEFGVKFEKGPHGQAILRK
jgi:hypothetical protein